MQAYAEEVKKLILTSKYLFTSEDDSTAVLFEKAMYTRPETIADCLIFSKSKGLIGVEIKTAHDSKARLKRQLHGYTRTCDYTWVLLHDTKLAEVTEILEEYPMVGIICYNEIDNELVPGIVKEARKTNITHYYTYGLAWKSELWHLVKSLPHPYLHTKYQIIKWLMKEGSYVYRAYINQWITGYKDPGRSFSIYDFKDQQSSYKQVP